MKCRLIAAGTRLPGWIDCGFEDYGKRLRKPLSLELIEIAVSSRAREAALMLDAVAAGDFVVALEVGGKAMSTAQLSAWLARRLEAGKPLALLIGGPDGLGPACLERADATWSLSPLTLPHGLVRVIVAEQLYRGISMLAGHPYHRA
jgi:23S rRNA (pseudouridine1915-N3)-methyltransferase